MLHEFCMDQSQFLVEYDRDRKGRRLDWQIWFSQNISAEIGSIPGISISVSVGIRIRLNTRKNGDIGRSSFPETEEEEEKIVANVGGSAPGREVAAAAQKIGCAHWRPGKQGAHLAVILEQ